MNVFPVLLFLFIAVPVIEIYLFITVGGWLGALPTIAIVIITAVVGVSLLRSQGLHTMQRAQALLSRGQPPAMEMMEGLVLVFLAALLLTPGFFTDAIGFLGLIPPLRRALIRGVLARRFLQPGPSGDGASFSTVTVEAEMVETQEQVGRQGRDDTGGARHGSRHGSSASSRKAHTLEGEFRRED